MLLHQRDIMDISVLLGIRGTMLSIQVSKGLCLEVSCALFPVLFLQLYFLQEPNQYYQPDSADTVACCEETAQASMAPPFPAPSYILMAETDRSDGTFAAVCCFISTRAADFLHLLLLLLLQCMLAPVAQTRNVVMAFVLHGLEFLF